MRHYEIMLLIHPDRSDQVSSMVQRYTELVQSANGTVHRLEDLKRRLLAYPINKLNKAYYVLLNIECNPKTQQEIQESAAFNDSIIRYSSIRQKSAVTEPSVLNNEGSDRPPNVKGKRATVTLKDGEIDYKNCEFLANFITDTKKISRRRITGGDNKQQHQLSEAIKRARLVGLLPYCDKYEQPEIN